MCFLFKFHYDLIIIKFNDLFLKLEVLDNLTEIKLATFVQLANDLIIQL